MNYTLIDILKKLKEERNEEKKKALVSKLRNLLDKDSSSVESYFRVSFNSLVKTALFKLTNNDEDLYFEVDAFCYIDEDGYKKISLFIAFIQDYLHVDKEFEKNLLEAVIRNITMLSLQEIINDVNVNDLQFRNGYYIKGA